MMRNGVLVPQNGCFDPYDGRRHPLGSQWNTDHCMRCDCSGDRMECCTRYGGIAHMEGCKGSVNPETCEYEFYRIDNPSEPCV
uniref:small serum protein 2-like n=1 Tax=Euleptes europaea TaxID=460621 RepID=UPI002541D951|nr:small serum protein 2-like [Euleptes europaea]